MSECFNCGYHYQGENDAFPCCHYPDDGFPAPCECEDLVPEDIDEDCGYDPFAGCYTDDC